MSTDSLPRETLEQKSLEMQKQLEALLDEIDRNKHESESISRESEYLCQYIGSMMAFQNRSIATQKKK
ncbi:hypothetical protein SJAG_03365 [Schizosaccharomyces japonicus yFS275]|uniref:Uncharacterized protein n=1 Tax=Schizosaccharomyces japonicus (strain yFS275 / FY16936) TaxID=402676 RepID=B6K417_SCHJY|nr:hypothetical protein SJAG_03365 [Schizosaccharomyces japonicus yFS275]EEB08224.1 hypothetical protein SJAG_03365 [Schizosaccharomyces japonicus yFS275]